MPLSLRVCFLRCITISENDLLFTCANTGISSKILKAIELKERDLPSHIQDSRHNSLLTTLGIQRVLVWMVNRKNMPYDELLFELRFIKDECSDKHKR